MNNKNLDWSKVLIKEIETENFTLMMDSDLVSDFKKITSQVKTPFTFAFNFLLRIGLDEAVKQGEKFKVPLMNKDKIKIGTRIKKDLSENVKLLQKQTGCSRGYVVNILLRTGFEFSLKEMEKLKNE